MERPFELSFTPSFWRAVDACGLCRMDTTSRSLSLQEDQFLGRDVTEKGGGVRCWDLSIKGKGQFRWYYIIDENKGVIENVIIIPDEGPSRTRAEEVVLMVRIADVAWRFFAGG